MADPVRRGFDPAERIRQIYSAFMTGDLVTLQHAATPEVVLHMAGDNPYSGTYEGVGEVMALVVDFGRELVPTSLEIEDVHTIGPREARTTVRLDLRRTNGRTTQTRIHQQYRFDDEGRVVETSAEAEDQAALDRFLTREG